LIKFILKDSATNQGKNPSRTSYEKLREVISFGSKKDGGRRIDGAEKKHLDFV